MKFQVGEIAVYHGLVVHTHNSGQECEILGVGPYPPQAVVAARGERIRTDVGSDYVVADEDGVYFVDEIKLRKRRPPIPDEVLTIFQGKPVEVEA